MIRFTFFLLNITTLFSFENSLLFSCGYRKDALNWEFKDLSLNLYESILTQERTYHLEWNDLKQITFGGVAHYTTSQDVLLKFQGFIASVAQGKFKESGLFAGYFPNGSVRAHGITSSFAFSLGTTLFFCDDDFQLAPLLGFATNGFNFHGNGVKSHGRFIGPTLGFEALYNLNADFRVYGSFDYCFATLFSKSHKEWHQNRAAFNQNAFGKGLLLAVGFDKCFWQMWNGGFKFTWNEWRSFRDGELFSDIQTKSEVFIKDTLMGPLKWDSFSLEMTINRAF